MLFCAVSHFCLVANFIEAGDPVYLFPNMTVRDVDMFIANITVALELCGGGTAADDLSWDVSFLASGSILVSYTRNMTQLYTISSPSGNPQVYTNFLR